VESCVHHDDNSARCESRADESDVPDMPPGHVKNGIPRSRRMEVGALCKLLIDYCRSEWLKKHCESVDLCRYVDEAISGENTLLLARVV
jgi:hypothetical protein